MAKRTDLKKILIIGSGPIVIGQAAEFDYAGTQACLALKEEGFEVVLCNSNPATIMTDTSIADKVYMEPLTLEYIAKILRYERPNAIIPGIGGQTGLNMAMQLEKKGVLKECQVELLGTSSKSIEQAEDTQRRTRSARSRLQSTGGKPRKGFFDKLRDGAELRPFAIIPYLPRKTQLPRHRGPHGCPPHCPR